MSNYQRLDDRCIESVVIRTILHKEVLQRANDLSLNLDTHEVSGDEVYRHDLAAYRAYGTPTLRWVITLLANLSDESEPLPQGSTLRLPEAAWIRERIRHYESGGELS